MREAIYIDFKGKSNLGLLRIAKCKKKGTMLGQALIPIKTPVLSGPRTRQRDFSSRVHQDFENTFHPDA